MGGDWRSGGRVYRRRHRHDGTAARDILQTHVLQGEGRRLDTPSVIIFQCDSARHRNLWFVFCSCTTGRVVKTTQRRETGNSPSSKSHTGANSNRSMKHGVFKSHNSVLLKMSLVVRLAERLKGLFNAFVGHTMQSMCQVLQANHSKTSGENTIHSSPGLEGSGRRIRLALFCGEQQCCNLSETHSDQLCRSPTRSPDHK